MSFGLRTWSDNGTPELDTDNFTYQVIHNQLYTIADRGVLSINVPGFTKETCCATLLPTQPITSDNVREAMPFMHVSPNNITIRSQNVNGGSYIGSTIQFRLLVMRYRN